MVISNYITPVMYTDITGMSWSSFWQGIGEWFNNTFGFSVCKEENIYGTYIGVLETRVGSGYCTSCDKPVTFFVSIPTMWWKLDQYSYGVKFTNSKGNGFKIFGGTTVGFGWYENGSATTISSSILGRVGVRQSKYDDTGFYSFTQVNINIPETVAVVVVIYYLIQYLESVNNPYSPQPQVPLY